MHTKWVCPSGTLRFCKNDSDSNLESLTVTRVESFCEKRDSSRVTIFLNVTRVESESLKIVTRVMLLLLQVTHCTTADTLVIPNFSLAGSVLSRNHGLARFVHERLEWSLVDQSPEQSETEWLCVDVAGYKIINVYKSPRSQFTPTAIPTFPHLSLYFGDFNCQHVNWDYNKTSPDVESLDSWATSNTPGLLYDPKETAGFFSHWWKVGTNPDLAFASFGQDSRLPDRRVLGKFPRSQHRPSLITPKKLKVPAYSDPVKRWNFQKADWKCFCHLTDESVERLPRLDTSNIERSYQDFKNGVPQGSVLAPLLFNIYISGLPTTVSRKYAYADDLAIMHADGDCQAMEGALNKDMATVSEYLQTWKLKLSTTKTVSAAFHLDNKEAKRELSQPQQRNPALLHRAQIPRSQGRTQRGEGWG